MKKIDTIILTGVSILALGLSGCATTADNMRAQGYGPDYSQGYGDGCASGKNAGGSMFDQFTKNVNLYDSSSKYRQGWEDGYKVCLSQEKQLMKNINEVSRDRAIKESGKYKYKY